MWIWVNVGTEMIEMGTASLNEAVKGIIAIKDDLIRAIKEEVGVFTGKGSEEDDAEQFSALYKRIREGIRIALPGFEKDVDAMCFDICVLTML